MCASNPLQVTLTTWNGPAPAINNDPRVTPHMVIIQSRAALDMSIAREMSFDSLYVTEI